MYLYRSFIRTLLCPRLGQFFNLRSPILSEIVLVKSGTVRTSIAHFLIPYLAVSKDWIVLRLRSLFCQKHILVKKRYFMYLYRVFPHTIPCCIQGRPLLSVPQEKAALARQKLARTIGHEHFCAATRLPLRHDVLQGITRRELDFVHTGRLGWFPPYHRQSITTSCMPVGFPLFLFPLAFLFQLGRFMSDRRLKAHAPLFPRSVLDKTERDVLCFRLRAQFLCFCSFPWFSVGLLCAPANHKQLSIGYWNMESAVHQYLLIRSHHLE